MHFIGDLSDTSQMQCGTRKLFSKWKWSEPISPKLSKKKHHNKAKMCVCLIAELTGLFENLMVFKGFGSIISASVRLDALSLARFPLRSRTSRAIHSACSTHSAGLLITDLFTVDKWTCHTWVELLPQQLASINAWPDWTAAAFNIISYTSARQTQMSAFERSAEDSVAEKRIHAVTAVGF